LATNASDAIGENNPEQGNIWIRTKVAGIQGSLRVQGVQITPSEYVLLEVEDNGSGIPRKKLNKIFEPFYTSKQIGRGTGLGLSIVYSVVKQHGGYVFCESALNKGTTFKIYLPVYSGEIQKNAEQVLSSERQVQVNRSRVQGVLLIDDEEMIRETTKECLQEFDYQVYEAVSAEEGLDFIKENRDKVDLIVLDLGMPGMGGQKFLEKLNEFEAEFKIIVASGYSNHKISKNPKSYGADAFLAKPYSTSKLISIINSL
jgi:CheY-like chemotaxis protein